MRGEKLGVVVIGCGGQGRRLPLFAARAQRLVALVDIDEKMECTNDPEVNQYVSRTYREGWEVGMAGR